MQPKEEMQKEDLQNLLLNFSLFEFSLHIFFTQLRRKKIYERRRRSCALSIHSIDTFLLPLYSENLWSSTEKAERKIHWRRFSLSHEVGVPKERRSMHGAEIFRVRRAFHFKSLVSFAVARCVFEDLKKSKKKKGRNLEIIKRSSTLKVILSRVSRIVPIKSFAEPIRSLKINQRNENVLFIKVEVKKKKRLKKIPSENSENSFDVLQKLKWVFWARKACL